MDLALSLLLSTAAATAIGVVRSIMVRRYAINAEVYTAVMQKLLRERFFERMQKLSKAAGSAIFPGSFAAADQALVNRLPKTPFPIARADAEEAFKKKRASELARFRASPLLDLVVLVAGAGAALEGYLDRSAYLGGIIGCGAVSLVLLLDVVHQRRQIKSADAAYASELIDLLTKARLEPDDPYRARQAPPAIVEKADPEGLWLRILRSGSEVDRVKIDQPILKIGRHASAQILLDDPEVARIHAVIEHDGDALDVIDLGSSQGTFVDGHKVNKSALVAGNRIDIGPFEIVVERGARADVTAPRAPAPSVNLERNCNACGARGFAPLADAPPSVVPPGYRAETCKNCGKVELFKAS